MNVKEAAMLQRLNRIEQVRGRNTLMLATKCGDQVRNWVAEMHMYTSY